MSERGLTNVEILIGRFLVAMCDQDAGSSKTQEGEKWSAVGEIMSREKGSPTKWGK